MPADLTQTTISVNGSGETFVFRIPSPADQVAVGIRVREILRRIQPDALPDTNGLDGNTIWLLDCLATFEVLLVSTSAVWPYSRGQDGKPVVDSQKFPPQSIGVVMEVIRGFQTARDEFLFGGTGDGVSAGTETVAGKSDSGAVPV